MTEPRDSDALDCPIAEACGGCRLIGTEYASQLAAKAETVRAAIDGYPALRSIPVSACISAPVTSHYRNRAKLAVVAEGNGLHIGLYASGTNRVVDLAPCRVQRPVLGAALEVVRKWLHEHRLARPAGPVIYVDLREAIDDRCHVTLVVDSRNGTTPPLPIESLLRALPALVGIAVNHGSADSSYPMGEETVAVHGSPSFLAPVETGDGDVVAFEVPAAGFFQVATSPLPAIHTKMREHLGDDGTLYDLYCGVGVHGLMVERGRGWRTPALVGIESSPDAVEAARRNAERFGVGARYLAARVEDVIGELLAKERATRIVMNPGRAGCRAPVLEALVEAHPPRLAYLSCNPTTLARDLAVLVAGGFDVAEVAPIDLMPQTDHVEALALLDRREAC